MTTTYRDTLRDIAYDNHGYVTTQDAEDVGVPAVELRKLAARGSLRNVGYGVYRMTDIPATAEDQFAEATLRVGEDAHLRGETVLALLGLANVNPKKLTVGTPHRVRRTMPEHVKVVRAHGDTRVTRYHGIRAQRVDDALLECRGHVPNLELREAALQARKEGLLTTKEWDRVRQAFA